MSENKSGQLAAGWTYAEGDPPGTVRFWTGTEWQGAPVPVGPPAGSAAPPPGPGNASAPSTGWSGTRKIVVGVAVALSLAAGVLTWTFLTGRAAADAANEFLQAIQDRDFVAAVDMVDRSCLGPDEASVATFEEGFGDVRMTGFELSVERVTASNTGNRTVLVGSATFDGGLEEPVAIEMIDDGGWGVCAVVFGDE